MTTERDALKAKVQVYDAALMASEARVRELIGERDILVSTLHQANEDRIGMIALAEGYKAKLEEAEEQAKGDLHLIQQAELFEAEWRKFEARAQAQAAALAEALADLVNQIRKSNPTDDHGHMLTMNRAYLEAEKLLDTTIREGR